MHDGFIRFAASVPELFLADPLHNAEAIVLAAHAAAAEGADVLVLPELCITGATCGDLFHQQALISAANTALKKICDETEALDLLLFVGLPVKYGSAVYNCVAAIQRGRILGLTPKSFPNSVIDCFFDTPDSATRFVSVAGQETAFGPNLVYCHEQIEDLRISVEIGSDAYAPISPAATACVNGAATAVVNCAAFAERAGESLRRTDMLKQFATHFCCAYVLASAGSYESTTDDVYSGHCIIIENGEVLCERKPFDSQAMIYSEIDVEMLNALRMKTGHFSAASNAFEEICFDTLVCEKTLTRKICRDPFALGTGQNATDASKDILDIQAQGLMRRLIHTGAKCVVLGISGGLDSTLALLATVHAFDLLGRNRDEIICVTMPCFGTSARTKNNAEILCSALGCDLRTIPIKDAVLQHFHDIGHDPENKDVTFENSQARERTQILMDLANREGGIVIGTGDLSELALGFATYNGDHMSMYGLNATVPKTMIRHIVSACADMCEDKALSSVLRDILDTPVSPELLPSAEGEISQKTEEILGDYILQDFFIYNALRYGFSPKKIYRLACCAFENEYSKDVIADKLKIFYRRFFTQQFKRSCLPDGPCVGEISFSPRGAFKMPSDATFNLWLKELEDM